MFVCVRLGFCSDGERVIPGACRQCARGTSPPGHTGLNDALGSQPPPDIHAYTPHKALPMTNSKAVFKRFGPERVAIRNIMTILHQIDAKMRSMMSREVSPRSVEWSISNVLASFSREFSNVLATFPTSSLVFQRPREFFAIFIPPFLFLDQFPPILCAIHIFANCVMFQNCPPPW